MLLKHIGKVVASAFFIALFVVISAGFAYAEDSVTVTVTASILNFREAPNTSAKVLDQLVRGEKLNSTGSSNGWYKVTKDGKIGWISADYASITDTQSSSDKAGTITGSDVNIRKGPGLTYTVIKQLDKGEKLTIQETTSDWYKVETSGGTVGWVSSLYIAVNSDTVTGKSPVRPDSGTEISRGGFSHEPATVAASDIIDYAKSLLGVKYTYGGNTPETGFDCSGFTKYVFDRFGIRLQRVAADQATQGTEVEQEDLRPGDLVFSDTDGGKDYINHVGIYIGDGQFISAASGSSTGKVVIQDLNSSYWQNTYMTARRII